MTQAILEERSSLLILKTHCILDYPINKRSFETARLHATRSFRSIRLHYARSFDTTQRHVKLLGNYSRSFKTAALMQGHSTKFQYSIFMQTIP